MSNSVSNDQWEYDQWTRAKCTMRMDKMSSRIWAMSNSQCTMSSQHRYIEAVRYSEQWSNEQWECKRWITNCTVRSDKMSNENVNNVSKYTLKTDKMSNKSPNNRSVLGHGNRFRMYLCLTSLTWPAPSPATLYPQRALLVQFDTYQDLTLNGSKRKRSRGVRRAMEAANQSGPL